MVEQFLKYIHSEKLFHSSQRILLAVSGGADSMLMLHLFTNAGFSVAVAHCNFGLRGSESDGDEQFVADYCDRHNLAFYVKHFNTQDYALEKVFRLKWQPATFAMPGLMVCFPNTIWIFLQLHIIRTM